MKNNPYQKEIIGIYLLGTLLLVVETWRRWDTLLSYLYLDDVWLVILAFIAAYFLKQKRYIGQLLWLFTCGAAFCMITGSFWFAFEEGRAIDASGYDMSTVLLVKFFMYLFVIFMSIRAFRLLLTHRFSN